MTYLDAIVAQRRIDVDGEDVAAVIARGEPRGFASALHRGTRPAIIAEFKRASPSAGDIAVAADAAEIARAYQAGGAAALSVLTEGRYFKGSFADLTAARAATSLPVLCKDFIVDERQLRHAADAGADAVLLIVAVLSSESLRSMIGQAGALGLETLVEAHDEAEAGAALAAGATLIGINNRDLRTFEVDPTTAIRVGRYLRAKGPAYAGPTTSGTIGPAVHPGPTTSGTVGPAVHPGPTTSGTGQADSITLVAESGYTEPEDLAACAAAGIDAVLIGERLMRADDRAAALRALASR